MNQIVQNIYNDILELSDLDKQKRYWLGKDLSYVSSYTEVLCRLFDDNDLDSFIAKSFEKGLQQNTTVELKKLRQFLNEYEEKQTDREIIEDPKWKKVVAQARVVIDSRNKDGGC